MFINSKLLNKENFQFYHIMFFNPDLYMYSIIIFYSYSKNICFKSTNKKEN